MLAPSQLLPNVEAFDSIADFVTEQIDAYADHLAKVPVFERRVCQLSPAFAESHYRGRLLNIYPLPKYLACRSTGAGDDAEHGTSVHFVTEELDGGPVILQARCRSCW